MQDAQPKSKVLPSIRWIGAAVANVVRCTALVIAIPCIAFGLFILYRNFGPQDSVGVNDDNCDVIDYIPSVPNGSGLVATAHGIGCGFDPELTTYIFVHKAGENDSGESLVFRYDDGQHFGHPQMTWSDNSHLHISVPALGLVTKQKASIDGVTISYSIGDVDETPWRHLEVEGGILLGWLLFWSGICALAVRSIRRRRRKLKRLNEASPLRA